MIFWRPSLIRMSQHIIGSVNALTSFNSESPTALIFRSVARLSANSPPASDCVTSTHPTSSRTSEQLWRRWKWTAKVWDCLQFGRSFRGGATHARAHRDRSRCNPGPTAQSDFTLIACSGRAQWSGGLSCRHKTTGQGMEKRALLLMKFLELTACAKTGNRWVFRPQQCTFVLLG